MIPEHGLPSGTLIYTDKRATLRAAEAFCFTAIMENSGSPLQGCETTVFLAKSISAELRLAWMHWLGE